MVLIRQFIGISRRSVMICCSIRRRKSVPQERFGLLESISWTFGRLLSSLPFQSISTRIGAEFGARMKSPLQRIRIGAIVLACVFFVAVLGYRFLAGYDWIGAIWMVVITISTVGHSETSGFSPGIQIFTVFVILFGMTASVYTFGGLMQLMLEGELERVIGRRKMTRDLQQLSKHIIICGYGRMGQHLVEDLQKESKLVVVVDNNPEVVNEAIAQGLLCIHGDATEEELLETLQIRSAKTLVITLPSDAESVFITLTARNISSSLQIVARAEQRSTEKKLRQAGADRVVMPTIVGAKQMVRMITRPTTAQLIDLVTESSFEDVELDEITIGASSPLAEKKLRDVLTLQNLGLLIVAIKRPDESLTFNPNGDVVFKPDDTIMVMGHPANIRRFRETA